MKNVLIISYYWPPAGGPGSQRVVKFAKYLPQFGWKPLVLTVNRGEYPYIDPSLERDIPPEARIYRTGSWEPFLFYKKLTHKKADTPLPVGMLTHNKKNFTERLAAWVRANIFIPDARIGWIPFAVRKGLEIIHRESIDLIFTSSPAHSLQLSGYRLKQKTGLPWIADFRDPWTDIRYYKDINRRQWARRLDESLERKVLLSVNHLTTVTRGLAKGFQGKVQSGDQLEYSILPNGFDESDFQGLRSQDSGEFHIVHTGNMLSNQNPRVLWQSLQQLLMDAPQMQKHLKIRFFGRVAEDVKRTISEFELQDMIQFSSFIPHQEIVQVMKDASILVLVVPNVSNNEGIATSKIFEYIGSGRPILVIGPPRGDSGKIVSRFRNSTVCNYSDIEHCKSFLLSTYKSWEKRAIHETPGAHRKAFSRQVLTAELAAIFDRFVQRR